MKTYPRKGDGGTISDFQRHSLYLSLALALSRGKILHTHTHTYIYKHVNKKKEIEGSREEFQKEIGGRIENFFKTQQI